MRLSYSCPSDQEVDAYGRFPEIRRYLDEHAATCSGCRLRLEPVRRARSRQKRGLATFVVAMLLLLGTSFPQGQAWLPPCSAQASPTAEDVAKPTLCDATPLLLNGHRFHGVEAQSIRDSFQAAQFKEVRKGDTLGRLARQIYGASSEDLWPALVEFNNHPENALNFERRYGRPLAVDDLPIGGLVQFPPRQVLLLIRHRVVVATAAADF